MGLTRSAEESMFGRTPQQQADYEADVRRRSPYATLAGEGVGLTAPGVGIAKTLSVIPKIGRYLGGAPTYTSQILGGTATGTITDLADSLAREGKLPDIGHAGVAGVIGAAGGLLGTGVSRIFSP